MIFSRRASYWTVKPPIAVHEWRCAERRRSKRAAPTRADSRAVASGPVSLLCATGFALSHQWDRDWVYHRTDAYVRCILTIPLSIKSRHRCTCISFNRIRDCVFVCDRACKASFRPRRRGTAKLSQWSGYYIPELCCSALVFIFIIFIRDCKLVCIGVSWILIVEVKLVCVCVNRSVVIEQSAVGGVEYSQRPSCLVCVWWAGSPVNDWLGLGRAALYTPNSWAPLATLHNHHPFESRRSAAVAAFPHSTPRKRGRERA